eukprot:6759496-Pyramimonas_sp.AAC.1
MGSLLAPAAPAPSTSGRAAAASARATPSGKRALEGALIFEGVRAHLLDIGLPALEGVSRMCLTKL